MSSSKQDLTRKSNALQIKQDDKFYTRLMSKESSVTKPSFRVVGSVPFMWESRPGTPKLAHSDTSLPPLTPPPSYYFKSSYQTPAKKHSRSNLLNLLFTRWCFKEIKNAPPSLSSPSSSLSASESPMPFAASLFNSEADYNQEADAGSLSPSWCFGIQRGKSSGVGRCYRW